MKLRDGIVIVLLILGVLMAVVSIPSTGAISREVLDRTAIARVTEDDSSNLYLEGFNNQSYNINNKFSNFGKIINNTNQTLLCNIEISVDFNDISNKNCELGFRIQDQVKKSINNGSSTVNYEIKLLPKQAYDFEALLDRNQNSLIYVSFGISAEATDGSFSIQLLDSPRSPRRVIFY